MPTKKKRKEKLSIYLSRDKAKPNFELIKLENTNGPIEIDLPETISSTLYIKKSLPKDPPPWTKLFTENQPIEKSAFGATSNVGAVFIVRLEYGTFLLSFGSGFHLLKQDSLERDFGLKVTLNSVNPDKLRSLDKASYDHNPLNSRTQSTKDVDIFNLHLDSEMELLYAITGTSLVKEFGSQVTGRDALTISVEASLKDIPIILNIAFNKYMEDLRPEFSWVDNINRVRDPVEIAILDLEIDEYLKNYNTEPFWIGEPEIVDWEDQIGYSFDMKPRTPRHTVLQFSDYLSYLNGSKPTVERMKTDIINVNNSEYRSVKCWSVYRCLYAEIPYDSSQYILRNGIWYRVKEDFVASINKHLEDLKQYDFPLPSYFHDEEDQYNKYVDKSCPEVELMDKNNIKIGGPYDKLEHCDLIVNGRDFVHVKIYKSSGTLSHLFAQGFASAESFITGSWYRSELNKKLPPSIKLDDPQKRPDPNDYCIVYAIATTKTLPDELPFLSKVTLKSALKTLRALNYNIAIAKIDIDDSLLKKTKIKGN